ncbi:MAG TPA: hypothetical protein VGL42_06410 [Opitutaceae bacterium]|jgi:hypothetical protein
MKSELVQPVSRTVDLFVAWLDRYGETSQDHQDFYNSQVGRAAKNFYYRHPGIGRFAVLPMVGCEAFAPWTRRFFYPRMRLPIADAHYAMGFALYHRVTGDPRHLQRAVHFLEVLESTKCPAYRNAGWGYPFQWQTRNGLIQSGTPLITTTPYCYEAFAYVYRLDGNPRWKETMASIARHVFEDYDDEETGPNAANSSYFPHLEHGVINASSYRGFMLTAAALEFAEPRYAAAAERNLNFVVQAQSPDGSWPYSTDGERTFVDHFHTCFVLKGLAKAEALAPRTAWRDAIDRGVAYYLEQLFDEDGLPKPFSRAPRLTVYKRELYDCAECLNLAALLRGRFPKLDQAADRLVEHLLQKWALPKGSFRSRKLLVGYDNVPMHRWGQSEIFRSLCALLTAERGYEANVAGLTPDHVRNLRNV